MGDKQILGVLNDLVGEIFEAQSRDVPAEPLGDTWSVMHSRQASDSARAQPVARDVT